MIRRNCVVTFFISLMAISLQSNSSAPRAVKQTYVLIFVEAEETRAKKGCPNDFHSGNGCTPSESAYSVSEIVSE